MFDVSLKDTVARRAYFESDQAGLPLFVLSCFFLFE